MQAVKNSRVIIDQIGSRKLLLSKCHCIENRNTKNRLQTVNFKAAFPEVKSPIADVALDILFAPDCRLRRLLRCLRRFSGLRNIGRSELDHFIIRICDALRNDQQHAQNAKRRDAGYCLTNKSFPVELRQLHQAEIRVARACHCEADKTGAGIGKGNVQQLKHHVDSTENL